MMYNYALFSKDILNKGFSLIQYGINEYAWKATDIKYIIDILAEYKIPILGGDVYKVIEGKIFQTFDSWYFKKNIEKNDYIKSYEETLQYILNYENRNSGIYIYSIVF